MPAKMRFGIGIGCVQCGCVTCTIATNDFGTNLDNMTIVSGAPSIAAGLLVMAAGDLIVFDDGAATSSDGTHLATSALTTSAAATLRLMLAYQDSSNYLFGELARSAGAATIRVGERVGGADSYLSDALTLTDSGSQLDLRHALELCWDAGQSQSAQSTSQGPKLPSAATGTLWTTPENVTDYGANDAIYTLSSGIESNSLDVSNLNFTIPAGSTIDGISVGALGVTTTGVGDVRDTTVTVQFGGASGTDQATNTTIGTGPITMSWGGSADLMGCTGIDWRDVNDPTFGVSFGFTDVVDGDQITIDAVEVIVYFTTPSVQPGTLRFQYTNSTDSSIQCVVARNVSANGLLGGLASFSGGWDLTHATLSYISSPTRQNCPACECPTPQVSCTDCCSAEELPFELVVDLGAVWPLTEDDTCSGATPAFLCANRGGEYVLENNGPFSEPAYCRWIFSDSQNTPEAPNFQVSITLVRDTADSLCQLFVVVSFQVSSDFPCLAARNVIYSSAKFDECPTFPVTLSRVSDVSPGGAANSPCIGASPATVTIDIP